MHLCFPTTLLCVCRHSRLIVLLVHSLNLVLKTQALQLQVLIWDLPNHGGSLNDYVSCLPSLTFEPFANGVCSTAQWLSSSVLVTGSADNSLLKLWHVADSIACLQSVQFQSSADAKAFFNHMVVQPEADLVILANARQKAVYSLHYTGSGSALQFDYLAEFTVSNPILSVTAQYRPADDPSVLQLYCVQANGIQMYHLNPALCCPTASLQVPSTEPRGSADSAVQQLQADVQSLTPGSQRPPSPVQPESQATAGLDLLSVTSPLLQQTISQQQPPPISTIPASAQVEHPKLLTPTHLMQQAKRSASQSSMASLPSQHTPTAAARLLLDNSDAVSTASTQGSKAQDISVSRQQSTETVPSSAAALDAVTSAQYDSPTASMSDSRASTPPPSTPGLPSAAYLTPEQYTTAPQSSSSGPMLGHSFDRSSTSSGASPVNLLRREDDPGAGAGPGQPPVAPTAPSAVFSQPLDLLPVHVASPQTAGPHMLDASTASADTQSQEVGQPEATGYTPLPGLPISGSELSEASVKRIADAVAERTLAQHKRVLSYLNEGHREMLRIIKADISKEGKRLQLAFDAQVS